MPRRWFLSKKDVKVLKKSITQQYPSIPLEFKRVEKIVDRDVGVILVVDNIPSLYLYGDKYYPLLTLLLMKGYEWIPYVVVDMGAVKPLLRGADVMAPGIRGVYGEFSIGDPVVVVEEKYRKPFVVAKALVSASELRAMVVRKGRVLENIHRIGDRLWKFVKKL